MAFATVIAAIGVASAVGGTYLQSKSRGEQSRALAQQSAIQAKANRQQASANRKISAASVKAEEARAEQAKLESARRRREIIRQGQLQRSTALANASNSGAQFSSGLAGAIGQVTGGTGANLVANAENTAIGQSIFASNQSIFNAQSVLAGQQTGTNAALAGTQSAFSNAQGQGALGQSLFNFGVNTVQNSETTGRVLENAFTQRVG